VFITGGVEIRNNEYRYAEELARIVAGGEYAGELRLPGVFTTRELRFTALNRKVVSETSWTS
jgi:hypothetical protein